MRMALALLLSVVGCGRSGVIDDHIGDDWAVAPGSASPIAGRPERDERFVGRWAVEQPTHALYEVTIYRLEASGALIEERSVPSDCGSHLEAHCETGSVARCVPAHEEESCTSELTCVFGDRWRSRGSSTLLIIGECSDGEAREIELAFDPDPSGNTGIGGGDATLISVGGERGWSHDNWPWAFRKCANADCDTLL